MILTDLFVNLCILVSLIFIYLQIRVELQLEKKERWRSILMDGVAGGLLGFFLMLFSIQVTAETMIDLRFVPVMLVMMYIGVPQAFISALLIIVTRFMFGFTTSAIAAMILMAVVMCGFMGIRKWLGAMTAKYHSYRMGLWMLLLLNVAFSVIISIVIKDAAVVTNIIIAYWIVSTSGGLIAVYFVEYVLKTQHLLMKYEKDSTTDFLTGLNNVRQFDSIWNTLMENALEKKERLSLVVLDIDHFKHVNDTYGHPVGDKILIELGKVLKENVRSFDVVSRNGGEEFSVILPDCPHQQTLEIAERVRHAVEQHDFRISSKEPLHITVSMGAATYPETVKEPLKIVDRADDSLYQAKRTGRNRICANPVVEL